MTWPSRTQNLNDSAYMDHPKDHSLFGSGLQRIKAEMTLVLIGSSALFWRAPTFKKRGQK